MGTEASVNIVTGCIKVVDTFRFKAYAHCLVCSGLMVAGLGASVMLPMLSWLAACGSILRLLPALFLKLVGQNR